ncbi:MAG: ribosome-associated translation inhibitor RaiA [Firmicutes bacterium]|jgi:putative sigma-54 modulation protein|nr:ribosome-associated translation inhibitor RaiA [Bacillota bacterium]
MDVIVRGKNMDVTEALHNHVAKKIGKLARFVDRPDVVAEAVLSVEKERQIVEVTVPLEGRLLRGEEATDDMYASADLVVDKLERQLEKLKGHLRTRHARSNGEDRSGSAPASVVRRKTFSPKPMSLDEARLQMEMLGHAFFAFANADTEQINVLYRRRDGNLGLLEPQ